MIQINCGHSLEKDFTYPFLAGRSHTRPRPRIRHEENIDDVMSGSKQANSATLCLCLRKCWALYAK